MTLVDFGPDNQALAKFNRLFAVFIHLFRLLVKESGSKPILTPVAKPNDGFCQRFFVCRVGVGWDRPDLGVCGCQRPQGQGQAVQVFQRQTVEHLGQADPEGAGGDYPRPPSKLQVSLFALALCNF